MNFVFEKIENDDHGSNLIGCGDINPSGIRRFTVSPTISMLLLWKRTKEKFPNLDLQTINFSTDPNVFEKYIIASGVAHHPNDWCGPDQNNIGADPLNPNKKNLFSFLNPIYLRDLQSRKAFLLLDQTHEGYQTNWMWEWFHSSCSNYKINPKQIIYITGNMAVKDHYNSWASDRDIKERLLVIPHATFEVMIALESKNGVKFFDKKVLPSYKEQIKYKTKYLDDIKIYNALQKRPRAHRMWFFKGLIDANLLDCGINSMNDFLFKHTYYEGRSMSPEEYNICKKLLPILPPGVRNTQEEIDIFADQDSGKYQLMFNEKITLDSWVSVISEASFGDNEETCFISEKTFKPIACNHPFIVFGNKGSMAALRDMGYKTFHPYIDETYDRLPTWERMASIISSLEKIKNIPLDERVSWFMKMREIIEFNYEKLMKSSKVIPDAIIEIKNYFEEK